MRKALIKQVTKEVTARIKKKIPNATVEVVDYGARFKLVVTQSDTGFRGFGYFTLNHNNALDSILMEHKLYEE